jgi:flagellar motor switch protein FliN
MTFDSNMVNPAPAGNQPGKSSEEHTVQPARFAPLAVGKGGSDLGTPLEFLYDVEMQVTVELGRTEMTLREILSMRLGTVIELNRLAGEPVDILINGKLIARGEVVVIDDMFGVRVIDILSPYDRLNSLRGSGGL